MADRWLTEEEADNVIIQAMIEAEDKWPEGERFYNARIAAVRQLKFQFGLKLSWQMATWVLKALGYEEDS